MTQEREIRVGDTVEIQQAWEDETGNYHDEFAQVMAIDDKGFMTLKFDRKDITKFLENCEYNVKDYKPEVVLTPSKI